MHSPLPWKNDGGTIVDAEGKAVMFNLSNDENQRANFELVVDAVNKYPDFLDVSLRDFDPIPWEKRYQAGICFYVNKTGFARLYPTPELSEKRTNSIISAVNQTKEKSA